MAMVGTFIGVDTYTDEMIRDLSCARRDATALAAIFQDTIPSLQAMLLTDEDATAEHVRHAIDTTLRGAGPDDTVILSFSGHGTHTHGLVAHDTRLDALPETTMPMEDLASLFRISRAGVIFCIIDCCFSGGAPARVLENSPILRDTSFSYQEFSGNGRFLLAASGLDEPALEDLSVGHGLLTKAVIDILQTGEGTISLAAAIDQIMDRVRAAAGKFGMVQNPVQIGYVEGGLVLPVLRPGEIYYRAFPKRRGVQVGPAIQELRLFGVPDVVLQAWAAQFPNGLNDLQHRAVNEYRVLDGASLLVIAPTSSGKTFIGEMAATRAIVSGRKAVFLLPYRALTNEKYDQFVSLYGERLNMRVIRCTGDYLDQTNAFVNAKYDLALLTYEMFLNLAVSNPAVLHQLGLVVLDETQFITDPGRGIAVELLLTNLLLARDRGIMPQIVALSAVVGDANDFDTWLGCRTLLTHERPVPLIEGVIDRAGVYYYRTADGRIETTHLVPSQAIYVRRDKPRAQDVVIPLVQELVRRGEKIIVFRNTRGDAQGCARYLARDLNLPPATKPLSLLPRYDASSTSSDLRTCLEHGTAFHNSNLSREEKMIVERAFRDPSGQVQALAATTTVAAGINTPASTVVLAETEFLGESGRPFTVAEYKNMAGRAGRLGYNEEGKAIIIAPNAYEAQRLLQTYVMGELESLHSTFDPRDVERWLIRLLAQVERVREDDVTRLIANTYGGYLAGRDDPKWQPTAQASLVGILDEMVRLDVVERERGYVQLTLLGKECGASPLSLRSVLRLIDLLKVSHLDTLTAERLMAVVQALPDWNDTYTPIFRKGQREMAWPAQAAWRYGMEMVKVLQRFPRDEWDYYGRCKRACVLWDWISGVPLETIESTYTTNVVSGRIQPGDITRFADTTRYYLRSAHKIASFVFVGQAPDIDAVEVLLKQVEAGIPADTVGLLALPFTLTRGEYLALRQVGVMTPAHVYGLDEEDGVRLLGQDRMRAIRAAAAKVSP